jgi:hypothetical protein
MPNQRRARCTVATAFLGNAWVQDITGPRTVPVMVQYVQVRERLERVVLRHGVQDLLRWRWTASGKYSAASAYNAMFIGHPRVHGAKELWKVKAPNKCRFFCGLCCTSVTGHRNGCGGTVSATTCCVRYTSRTARPPAT